MIPKIIIFMLLLFLNIPTVGTEIFQETKEEKKFDIHTISLLEYVRAHIGVMSPWQKKIISATTSIVTSFVTYLILDHVSTIVRNSLSANVWPLLPFVRNDYNRGYSEDKHYSCAILCNHSYANQFSSPLTKNPCKVQNYIDNNNIGKFFKIIIPSLIYGVAAFTLKIYGVHLFDSYIQSNVLHTLTQDQTKVAKTIQCAVQIAGINLKPIATQLYKHCPTF